MKKFRHKTLKNKFFGFLLILPLILFACKTTQQPISILNLNNAQGLQNYSNLYSLPKTVIRVKVTVERVKYIRGPYYAYAGSLLGLSDVISEDRQKWRIASVEFDTYAIPDSNHVYLIETSNEFKPLSMSFDRFGLLESINDIRHLSRDKTILNNTADDEDRIEMKPSANVLFTDTGSSSFDEVPIPKAVLAKKTNSEQAAVFAASILTLRDDRAAILVGDGYTTALPAGETMRTMIEKIDEIQEKYLTMFKGKVNIQTFDYYFDFVPNEPRKRTQAILFRFSDNAGIVETNDMSGSPVIIEVESYENLKQFEQFKKRQYYLERVNFKGENEKGFCFRQPEMGIVKLIKNDKVLKDEKILVAQFGSVQYLPFHYLEGGYAINLYPGLGSLKSITEIESLQPLKKDKKKNK
jgi:hypothetical protein